MVKQSEVFAVPQTIKELKDRIVYLNERGGRHKIGKRTLSAIQNMLDNPNETAVSSISLLAEKNNINASTLTRLSKKLGYNGFNSLQSVFRRNIAKNQSYYSDHIEELLKPSEKGEQEEMIHLVSKEEIANIMKIVEKNKPFQLRNAAKALINKRRVHILGLRASFSVAHYLAYYLGIIGIDVKTVSNSGQTLAEDLAGIEKEDTVLVISFRPYTKDTVVAFRTAKKVGAEIVSITDHILSPIINDTKNTLIVESRKPFFFDNAASTLVLIEALLAEVVNLMGDKAITELKKREALFKELEIESF